ncbi:hypothetical protein RhiTH_009095 [Rhizoctonia solani]
MAANNPTMEEALAGPQALKWWKAMQNEVNTFDKLDTTKLTELTYKRKAMGNKWVLMLKQDENGEPMQTKVFKVPLSNDDLHKTYKPQEYPQYAMLS